MKKALIYAAVIFFLFIIVSRACSGCKKHKPAANNDSVSQSVDSDVAQEATDDSVVDDSVVDDSKDSSLNEDAESNEELNEDASPAPVVDESNPNNVVVVVKGDGETFTEAKKDAMRNAVEQVVGALVDAQTRVENDELIEQILTASSAYIEKSEVLSTKKANGMITVKLRATVVKMSLTKKLKLGGGGQTIAVDGANLVDMANSKVDAEKSGALFLANFLKKEEFPYSLLDTKVLGQPQIAQKGNEVVYTLKVETSVNRERYMDFVKRVKPIFDKYAIEHNSFVLETHMDRNRITYTRNYVPGYEYKGSNLPFYLCTEITGNFHSLKFDTYELPKKFKVPLGYYKRVVPVVEVLLLDGENEVIATKRTMLSYIHIATESTSIEPLNAMPSMFWENELERHGVIGESTILKLEYHQHDFNSGWCVFAPYRVNYYNSLIIIPASIFDVSIVLSPAEFTKVKSAKIAVIVNNPEMDKAYERMESEIEQIPTD